MRFRREGLTWEEAVEMRRLSFHCNSVPWDGHAAGCVLLTVTWSRIEGESFAVESRFHFAPKPQNELKVLADGVKTFPLYDTADFNGVDFGKRVE